MVAAVIQGLERFSHVVFVLLKRDKVILATTFLQTFLTVLFDYLFVSDLPGSFRMGVIGLALSNICILEPTIALRKIRSLLGVRGIIASYFLFHYAKRLGGFRVVTMFGEGVHFCPDRHIQAARHVKQSHPKFPKFWDKLYVDTCPNNSKNRQTFVKPQAPTS